MDRGGPTPSLLLTIQLKLLEALTASQYDILSCIFFLKKIG